jgi:hypothetical protein
MNLDLLIALILLSIISAFIGFGFNRMQDPDMIFQWYREWLNRMPYIPIKRYQIDYLSTVSNPKPILTTIRHKKSMFLYYLSKPLGLCIICNTTWIGMILTTIFLFKGDWIIILYDLIVGCSSAGLVVLIVNKYNQLQRNK